MMMTVLKKWLKKFFTTGNEIDNQQRIVGDHINKQEKKIKEKNKQL